MGSHEHDDHDHGHEGGPGHVSGSGEVQHIHPDPTSFIRKWIFSTDHKVIAKQFLWLGLMFLLVGGTMAMMIRWQLANPGQKFPLIGSFVFANSDGVSARAYRIQFETR